MGKRILKLEACNVKRLKAIEITPAGNVVIIGGPNEAGKSSALDSIMYALGGAGTHAPQPVRNGEKKAVIKLDIGGDAGTELTVTKTISAKGSVQLVVEDAEGKPKSSPQGILDKLVGAISFDPSEFNRMKGPKQRETLKALDPSLDFTALEEKRQDIYDERQAINRQAKDASGAASQLSFNPDAPEEFVDVADLTVELEKRLGINASNTESREKLNGLSVRMDEIVAKAESLRQELSASELAIESAKILIDEQGALVGALEDANAEDIRQQIAAAKGVNDAVAQNKSRKDAMKKAEDLAARSETLTEDIEGLDEQKQNAIENASFPIEGLGFDVDGVTFNGVPFEQASQSERWRASIAIGAAMNPGLRVLLIREGALLDDIRLKMVAQMAEDLDMQLWIEDVSDGRASVVIEDGAIKKEE